MTFPYARQNDESRRRLQALVGKLSEADLARTTDYGWTVAALLAHLAFWDQRMVVILQRWQADGFDPSPIDAAAVNDALKVICHLLEPRRAMELCLSSAEAADTALAALAPELVQQIEAHAEASETQFRMNRSLHRDGHLKDVEALIAQGK